MLPPTGRTECSEVYPHEVWPLPCRQGAVCFNPRPFLLLPAGTKIPWSGLGWWVSAGPLRSRLRGDHLYKTLVWAMLVKEYRAGKGELGSRQTVLQGLPRGGGGRKVSGVS